MEFDTWQPQESFQETLSRMNKREMKRLYKYLEKEIRNEEYQEFSGVLTTTTTSEIKSNIKTTNSPDSNTINHHANNTVQISIPSNPVEVNDSTEVCGAESISTEFPLLKEPPSPFNFDHPLSANVKEPAKKLLFWVKGSVQNKNLWVLADTGSSRNLMSEKFWKQLPIPPKLSPSGSTVVVAGDGKILDLLGWIILNFDIAGQTVYHEVGVVKDLPLEFLMGGEVMKSH